MFPKFAFQNVLIENIDMMSMLFQIAGLGAGGDRGVAVRKTVVHIELGGGTPEPEGAQIVGRPRGRLR